MKNKAVVLWALKSSIITVLVYYYVKTPEAGNKSQKKVTVR